MSNEAEDAERESVEQHITKKLKQVDWIRNNAHVLPPDNFIAVTIDDIIEIIHELMPYTLSMKERWQREERHKLLAEIEGKEHALVFREVEYLLEALGEENEGTWIKEKLEILRRHYLPKNHPDYWKYHCATCGLWYPGEPEEEGYCQCDWN